LLGFFFAQYSGDMMKTLLFTVALAISQIAVSAPLDTENSVLNIISTKNGTFAEIHSFSGLTGSLSKSGSVEVSVPLASINTGIEIRNQRMRDFLFNTEVFPTASFEANIDVTAIELLEVGEVSELRVNGEITMNGQTAKTLVNVVIARQLDGSLIIATKQPFIINAQDFGYVDGINKLKELAALPSISTAVPVTFSVVFK
jgi:polyisoprenoid-binding protein YceI